MHGAFSYWCVRPYATSVCGLKQISDTGQAVPHITLGEGPRDQPGVLKVKAVLDCLLAQVA